MCGNHPIFSDEEEMIEEMLMPGGCMGCREATETDSQKVHVEVGDLSPSIECWGQAER